MLTQQNARRWGLLVADDDPEIRALLEERLPEYGFAVWMAGDGPEAVNLYCQRRKSIDIVLLDVCMPHQGGPETLAALRVCGLDVPCCFMSGGFGNHTAEELSKMSAAAIFMKPFSLADVGRALRSIADAQSTSCPTRANCAPHSFGGRVNA